MPCDGSCCVAFPIGNGTVGLDWLRSGRVFDGDLLGFMLRALTTEEAIERRARFGVELKIDPDVTYYRCIYWDEKTRLCGAYANRPGMCSDYPYPLSAQRYAAEGSGMNTDGICEHGCDCQGAPLVVLGEN